MIKSHNGEFTGELENNAEFIRQDKANQAEQRKVAEEAARRQRQSAEEANARQEAAESARRTSLDAARRKEAVNTPVHRIAPAYEGRAEEARRLRLGLPVKRGE